MNIVKVKYQNRKQEENHMKKKGILAVALSLCLVAVVAIGATLALLSDTTEEKVNHFTVSTKGIEIELRELHWDNDPFTG